MVVIVLLSSCGEVYRCISKVRVGWIIPTDLATRCTTSSACMSLAAVKNDAMATRKRLLAKKQLLCTAAPVASAFGGSAS